MSMQEIEAKAKAFAAARDELAERMQRLRDEQEAVKRKLLAGIRNSVSRFKAEHEVLLALVEANPQLFERPKSRTLHNIKLGWLKQRGRIEIEDVARTVELIEKHLSDQADALIRTTKAPDKKALAELPGKDLKRIGVAVTEDIDMPFVRNADDAIAKMIDALLGSDELEELVS
jgi:hypothetical protein